MSGTTGNHDHSADDHPVGGRTACLPLVERERLQKIFDRAKRSLEQGDFAYAHDLFSQCVSEDPGALIYLQHFRANLAQMHPNAKALRASGFATLGFGGGRSAVAKAAGRGAWRDAFAVGCKTLKKSAGDTGVLAEMATACGELGHTDCQLYYLRWALDLEPKDVEINKQAAHALEAIGEFDQAIGCWARVQQQKPADEEPGRAIARLSVEKTIDRGGYNPLLLKGAAEVTLPKPLRVKDASELHQRNADAEDSVLAEEALAESDPTASEEDLRAAIESAPTDPKTYVRLADHFAKAGRLQDAERLLRKALQVSGGGDLVVVEKLEEVHLARMRERVQIADARAARQGSEASKRLAEQMRQEANQSEVIVWTARADRSPGDPKLQFELGMRLKRVGNHRAAVPPLQGARKDKKRLAEAELNLGECFQHIEQHALAMRSYEAAIAACPPGEWTDLRKLAHYRAGVLAMGLRDYDTAEQRFTDLASADFGYRDVGDRLDKIARLRNAT